MKYVYMLNGCHMAMSCFQSNNIDKIIKAFEILDKMRTNLPVIGPEPDLMYAHAMYHFSKAECFNYFRNFEQSIVQMEQVVSICILAHKCLFKPKYKSLFLINNLHYRTGYRMRTYIDELGKPTSMFSHKCKLCEKDYPNQTGSHLVPHLLIKYLFPRNKEIAVVENHSKAYYFKYVGRDLAPHIDEIKGYQLSEEERDMEALMQNPLTRDNIFCIKCERKFSLIETEMLKVHELQLAEKPYEYKVPYLFWLSIIWRMSVGNMSIKLDDKTEKKIRQILDSSIDDKGHSILNTLIHVSITAPLIVVI